MSGAPTLYLDDLKPGMVLPLGSVRVTREEILEFARRYDPQPIHLDEEAARASIYGGLISSGWLTVSLGMRRIVDGFLLHAASLGAPGCDEVVRDGESGILTKGDPASLAEAAIGLLLDDQRRTAMAARARQIAEREFGVERQLTRTLEVYAEAQRIRG